LKVRDGPRLLTQELEDPDPHRVGERLEQVGLQGRDLWHEDTVPLQDIERNTQVKVAHPSRYTRRRRRA
jgi:hypothetical protein